MVYFQNNQLYCWKINKQQLVLQVEKYLIESENQSELLKTKIGIEEVKSSKCLNVKSETVLLVSSSMVSAYLY